MRTSESSNRAFRLRPTRQPSRSLILSRTWAISAHNHQRSFLPKVTTPFRSEGGSAGRYRPLGSQFSSQPASASTPAAPQQGHRSRVSEHHTTAAERAQGPHPAEPGHAGSILQRTGQQRRRPPPAATDHGAVGSIFSPAITPQTAPCGAVFALVHQSHPKATETRPSTVPSRNWARCARLVMRRQPTRNATPAGIAQTAASWRRRRPPLATSPALEKQSTPPANRPNPRGVEEVHSLPDYGQPRKRDILRSAGVPARNPAPVIW